MRSRVLLATAVQQLLLLSVVYMCMHDLVVLIVVTAVSAITCCYCCTASMLQGSIHTHGDTRRILLANLKFQSTQTRGVRRHLAPSSSRQQRGGRGRSRTYSAGRKVDDGNVEAPKRKKSNHHHHHHEIKETAKTKTTRPVRNNHITQRQAPKDNRCCAVCRSMTAVSLTIYEVHMYIRTI